METYEFSGIFSLGTLLISPVHVRIEQLRPVIAAHNHSNTSYEIHYTERGQGAVTVNGESYTVTADTLYITGPGVKHAQTASADAPILEYCLYLDCQRSVMTPGDPFALFTDTTFWMGMDEGRIFSLLQELIEENRHPRLGIREMSETILRQIIIRLTRMYHQKNTAAHAEIRTPMLTRAGLMPIIEDAFFYRYHSLTLDDLARLLNLSVRQTQRLLRQNFGKTFSQKLIEARIAAASQYLLNTDLSITEISERTGFSSIEYFSGVFRRINGYSPRQFRKEGTIPQK